MSYLHDDLDDAVKPAADHRELTLSTGSILGIFFGLTLLCALFFGFGYNMGSRSHQAPVVATAATPSNNADFSSFKPSPSTPAGTPAATSAPAKPVESPTPSGPATQPAPIVRLPPPSASSVPPPGRAAESPVASPASSAPRAVSPANEAGITFTVQVAAVSHQEDAELLVAALRRKGYAVAARTEPQDKLFHIQVGPFASKRDADAMRQRLQGDGYNAIVK